MGTPEPGTDDYQRVSKQRTEVEALTYLNDWSDRYHGGVWIVDSWASFSREGTADRSGIGWKDGDLSGGPICAVGLGGSTTINSSSSDLADLLIQLVSFNEKDVKRKLSTYCISEGAVSISKSYCAQGGNEGDCGAHLEDLLPLNELIECWKGVKWRSR